jgi:hypothetical protein
VRGPALSAFILGWLVTSHVAAEEGGSWKFRSLKGDRRMAHVDLVGRGPGGPVNATLVISREASAGRKPIERDGATIPPVLMQLCIHDAKQAVPFQQDYYKGPDSPAAKSKLVKITGGAGENATMDKFVASGWYSNLSIVLDPFSSDSADKLSKEPLSFVFGIGSPSRDFPALLSVVDRLMTGEVSLTFEITSYAKPESRLEFKVPRSGAAEAMAKLLSKK